MVFLLVVIYVAFIGLGVPDSLIGSAWPAIQNEMGIPIEAVSILTLLISGCTVLSSIFSARLLNKIGTAKVTAFSTALTAAALLGFSFATSFYFMIPLAIILGLGAGAVDSGLNNYVALHFKASHMNFLHCFYGVGVTLSPYLMAIALGNVGWRSGYRYAFYVQAGITLLMIVSLPLWNKSKSGEEAEEDVWVWLAPKNNYHLPMDDILLNNDVLSVSHKKKQLCIFETVSEKQIDAISKRQFEEGHTDIPHNN